MYATLCVIYAALTRVIKKYVTHNSIFTPVSAVGDYPLVVSSKDEETIEDKLVHNMHSSEISTNVVRRLGAVGLTGGLSG